MYLRLLTGDCTDVTSSLAVRVPGFTRVTLIGSGVVRCGPVPLAGGTTKSQTGNRYGGVRRRNGRSPHRVGRPESPGGHLDRGRRLPGESREPHRNDLDRPDGTPHRAKTLRFDGRPRHYRPLPTARPLRPDRSGSLPLRARQGNWPHARDACGIRRAGLMTDHLRLGAVDRTLEHLVLALIGDPLKPVRGHGQETVASVHGVGEAALDLVLKVSVEAFRAGLIGAGLCLCGTMSASLLLRSGIGTTSPYMTDDLNGRQASTRRRSVARPTTAGRGPGSASARVEDGLVAAGWRATR